MRRRFSLRFVLTFVGIYALLCLYVGFKGWQWAAVAFPGLSGWSYWAPYLLVGSSFLVSRLAAGRAPQWLVDVSSVIGAYWLGFFVYALLISVAVEMVRVFLPQSPALILYGGGVAVALLFGLVISGIWQSWRVVVRRYDLTIEKPCGRHRELHVVMASDLHAGAAHGRARVRQLVRMVRELNPDLLLIAGDMVDDSARTFVAQGMDRELAALKVPLGIYAVVGNHDEPGAEKVEFRKIMERAGIRLLIDESVLVDGSFYLIGRDDLVNQAIRGRPRATLEQLMKGLDRRRPILVMDHQPYRLAEAADAGVDLQVSGHTHRGQLWPFHYVTRRIWELDWGYLQKRATHFIVSLGFGTWGPPLRVGHRPELVSIRIRFQ